MLIIDWLATGPKINMCLIQTTIAIVCARNLSLLLKHGSISQYTVPHPSSHNICLLWNNLSLLICEHIAPIDLYTYCTPYLHRVGLLNRIINLTCALWRFETKKPYAHYTFIAAQFHKVVGGQRAMQCVQLNSGGLDFANRCNVKVMQLFAMTTPPNTIQMCVCVSVAR